MLTNILLMILDTVAGFLTGLLLARFIMQWARLSFRSPLGTFVVAATDWLVRPLRRVIPGLFGLDFSCLIPAWLIQALMLALTLALTWGSFGALAVPALLGAAAVKLVHLALYLVMFVVLASAVLSWVNPYSPLAPTLNGIAAPLLRPIQRVIPLVGNVDLSPLVLLLILQVLQMVLNYLVAGLLRLSA